MIRVAVEMWREARKTMGLDSGLGSPISQDPVKQNTTNRRGQGGFVRAIGILRKKSS